MQFVKGSRRCDCKSTYSNESVHSNIPMGSPPGIRHFKVSVVQIYIAKNGVQVIHLRLSLSVRALCPSAIQKLDPSVKYSPQKFKHSSRVQWRTCLGTRSQPCTREWYLGTWSTQSPNASRHTIKFAVLFFR